jgi:hypothetical protein
MRSLNQRNRSVTGSRIHTLMEARASCVSDPSTEELDRELKRIMAPGPRPVNEDLPCRELAPSGRTAVRASAVCILQGGVTAAALIIRAGNTIAAVVILTVLSGVVMVLLAIAPPGSRIAAKVGERPVRGRGLPHEE